MTKKTWIIIGVALVAIVIFVVVLVTSNKDKNEVGNNNLIPTLTPEPTPLRTNSTGGLVKQTQEEENMAAQISALRLKCPIITNNFIITMDWKIGSFVIKKKSGSLNSGDVEKWLKDNGYGLITIDNYKIE